MAEKYIVSSGFTLNATTNSLYYSAAIKSTPARIKYQINSFFRLHSTLFTTATLFSHYITPSSSVELSFGKLF